MTATDPTRPLVLNTRSLRRQAGAMVTVARTFPAPGGWSVSSAAVDEGAPVQLDARLEAVVEGVLVTGVLTSVMTAECSRCLDPIRSGISVRLMQLFEYPDQRPARDDETDEPLPVMDGDFIDLEPTVRDAVVLDLPLAPLCSSDCPGLCVTCGIRLADNPGHRHDVQDSRWAALRQVQDAQQTGIDVSARPAGSMEAEQKGL